MNEKCWKRFNNKIIASQVSKKSVFVCKKKIIWTKKSEMSFGIIYWNEQFMKSNLKSVYNLLRKVIIILKHWNIYCMFNHKNFFKQTYFSLNIIFSVFTFLMLNRKSKNLCSHKFFINFKVYTNWTSGIFSQSTEIRKI